MFELLEDLNILFSVTNQESVTIPYIAYEFNKSLLITSVSAIAQLLLFIAQLTFIVILWIQYKRLIEQNEILRSQTLSQNRQTEHYIEQEKVKRSSEYVNEFYSEQFQRSIIDTLNKSESDIITKLSDQIPDLNHTNFRYTKQIIDSAILDDDFNIAFHKLTTFFNGLGYLFIRNLIDKDYIVEVLFNNSHHWYIKVSPMIKTIPQQDKTYWQLMHEEMIQIVKEKYQLDENTNSDVSRRTK